MASITTGETEQWLHTCRHCQAVTINLSRTPSNRSAFTDQGTLDISCARARQAAADGCKLFAFLMQSNPGDRETKDSLRYTFSYKHSPAATSSISFQYPAVSQDFEVYAGDHVTLGDFHAPPNLAPASLETAAEWLESCVQGHPECARASERFAPPRLLRVACAHDEVHLVSVDVTKPVPYAVLSYCWGGSQPFRTLNSNVATVVRAMKDLPRTIQDAVSVTRQLKLEYLWVDSMCIIQDNAEDKSALLGQMHKIYACGHVTIAASKAAKCTEGFLAPRYDVPGFSIPIRYPSASDSVPRLGSVILMPSSRRSVEPLVTRAWTLQESLLSRRILSYGNRQLRWYCASGDEQCDGGVLDRNSANFASFQSLEETVIDYPRRRMEVKSLPHDPTSLPWLEIVEQYTMRGLSVSSDKLIAISAVAQRLVSLTQGKWGRYYAGIWEERFFEQLLWAMSTGEITKRPAEYRAPSWSWAAIDGRPKWPWTEHLVDAKISCKLLGVETETSKSEQSFGAVSAGKLRLFGRLKKATWSADRRTIRDSKTQASVTGGSMQTFPDALDDSAQETTVYILEVARRSYIADTMAAFNLRRRSHAGKYVAGLVLKHCGGKVYQRVGFIGLKSKKINTIVLATGWDTVENKSWWSEGFNEMEITIT